MSEQVISKEKFAVIGKSKENMESISRPTLTFWQEAWRRIKKNRIAFFSLPRTQIQIPVYRAVSNYHCTCHPDRPRA